MAELKARDPDFEARVRDSFARQAFMSHIGARMTHLSPGRCELTVTYSRDLTQQHHFFHGGVTGAIADTAAGYAAYSLMPAGASVLTTEYKINLLAPAEGEALVARAEVAKSGRTLTVVTADVFAIKDGEEVRCATALASMLCLHDIDDGPKM